MVYLLYKNVLFQQYSTCFPRPIRGCYFQSQLVKVDPRYIEYFRYSFRDDTSVMVYVLYEKMYYLGKTVPVFQGLSDVSISIDIGADMKCRGISI